MTMDKLDTLLLDGAIYIEDSKIVDIGKTGVLEKMYKADEVMDASNGVVMPGLINSHVHFTSVLRRGVEDDLPLEEWLDTLPWMGPRPIQRVRELISKEELAAAFRLVCLEMIKAGITCYSAGAGMLRERYESGLRAFNALFIPTKLEITKASFNVLRKTIQIVFSLDWDLGFPLFLRIRC